MHKAGLLRTSRTVAPPASASQEPAFSPTLDPEASAAFRDQLAAELKGIGSIEDATSWAHRVLAAKGTLQPGDARQIGKVFQERILALERAGDAAIPRRSRNKAKPSITAPDICKRQAQLNCDVSIDKSSLAHPEPRRIRDRDHLRFVAKQDCLICGRKPSDAHHLRFTQHRALGRKASDEFSVPLCRGHHREVHRSGDEVLWWQKVGINPAVAARALWLKSHPLPTSVEALRVDRGRSGDATGSAIGPSLPNDEKNLPIVEQPSDDLAEAASGQPPQRYKKH